MYIIQYSLQTGEVVDCEKTSSLPTPSLYEGFLDISGSIAGRNEFIAMRHAVFSGLKYVDLNDSTLKDRPSIGAVLSKGTITANGVDTATISGIEAGLLIHIVDASGSELITADGSDLDITSGVVDTIRIVVKGFPHIAEGLIVEAE